MYLIRSHVTFASLKRSYLWTGFEEGLYLQKVLSASILRQLAAAGDDPAKICQPFITCFTHILPFPLSVRLDMLTICPL